VHFRVELVERRHPCKLSKREDGTWAGGSLLYITNGTNILFDFMDEIVSCKGMIHIDNQTNTKRRHDLKGSQEGNKAE
jgi:hypothetical protein